jgi:DNA excision repair protein ERCC-4
MVMCRAPSAVRDTKPQASPADADLFVSPFVVIQDTREQAPWLFSEIVIERRLWIIRRVVGTLATGDYSIEGYESLLCVERKSASDLVGSVTAGNARFRKEHERMHAMVEHGGRACVVVEGSLSAICAELDADDSRRVTGASILGCVAEWPFRFGIPWFFAGDRRTAELLAFRVLLKSWREVCNENRST